MPKRLTELTTRRAWNAKTYLTDAAPIGARPVYETELYPGPIHYRAENGWEDIDTRLVADAADGYTHSCRKTFLPVRLNKNAKQPVRVEFGSGRHVTYRAEGGNPSLGQVDGSAVTYPDAWQDTDLRLSVVNWGLKEEVILKTPASPTLFSFRLELADLTAHQTPHGIEFRDGDDVVGGIPLPHLMDAAGVAGPCSLALRADGSKEYVDLSIDPAWLADPARVYPVVLDPTTTFTPPVSADDGYVLRVGSDYPPTGAYTVDTTATTAYPKRSRTGESPDWDYPLAVALIRWDTSAIPDAATILSAIMRLFVDSKEDANSRSVSAGWYASANWPIDEADWTSTPGTTAHAGKTIASITMAADNDWTLLSPDANVSKTNYTGLRLHVTGAAPTGENYITFRTRDHATSANWPRLVVTYNTAPTATPTDPLGTVGAPATITDEVTPRLSWTYSDPDADPQVKYQVQIYQDDNLVRDTGEVASANPYHDVLLATGLKYATLYRWRVRVYDGFLWGGWSDPTLTYFKCVYSAVTGLTATPNPGLARIDLAWNAHPGERLAGYQVERRKAGGTWAVLASLVVATAYPDRLVVSGQEYEYRVSARAADGYIGPASATDSAAVTVVGAWLEDLAIRTQHGPSPEHPERGSRQAGTDSSWLVQKLGRLPRVLPLTARYEDRATLEALLALLYQNGLLTYRDELGFALRGKVTGPLAEASMDLAGRYYGWLTFELAETDT